MPTPLPRDPDGYVDLDAVDEDPVDLDLAAVAPVPPLADETWDVLVGAAPHTDPDLLDVDIDALVDPLAYAEVPMAAAAAAPWSDDVGADGLEGVDDHTDLPLDPSDDATDAFDTDDTPFSDD